MSDATADRAEVSASDDASGVVHESGRGRWRIRLITVGLLLTLSVVGMFVTNWRAELAWRYWTAMIFVFGGVSMLQTWLTTPHEKRRLSWSLLGKQFLHWFGTLIMMKLIVVFVMIGPVDSQGAGLDLLCMLALATFLAGVHFDPLYMLVGIVLGGIAWLSALAEEYIIFIMLPIALAGGGFIWWKLRRAGSAANA